MSVSSHRCQALADLARSALLEELALYPKPGLVSLVDSGSHRDMDHTHLRASANALHAAFRELAHAGANGAAFKANLVPIGLRAERVMLTATGGVNTHRGALFALGLLAAAAAGNSTNIRAAVVAQWGAELAEHMSPGRAGAREEAAQGFPSIFQLALPHFQSMIQSGRSRQAAAMETLFLLIANVDDTNLVHRGGLDGSVFAKNRAAFFLNAGGTSQPDWLDLAKLIHSEFVGRNLSPGGSADLLAGTLFVYDAMRLEVFSTSAEKGARATD